MFINSVNSAKAKKHLNHCNYEVSLIFPVVIDMYNTHMQRYSNDKLIQFPPNNTKTEAFLFWFTSVCNFRLIWGKKMADLWI